MKNIVIIGAGISGLYIANLLCKNSNYKITIYEKNSSVNLEKGYGTTNRLYRSLSTSLARKKY